MLIVKILSKEFLIEQVIKMNAANKSDALKVPIQYAHIKLQTRHTHIQNVKTEE